MNHKLKIKNYFCMRYLRHFPTSEILAKHKKLCDRNKTQAGVMPTSAKTQYS